MIYFPLSVHKNNSSPHSASKIGLTDVIAIECGSYYSMALTKSGLYAWGENDYGQLGFGFGYLGDSKIVNTPHKLEFENIIDIISINCGTSSTFILMKGDKIFVFGRNGYGQLGLGFKNACIKCPSRLVIPNVIKICCKSKHVIALTSERTIYIWGRNNYGQLGLKGDNFCDKPALLKI